jgi:hypothetical protein
MKIARLQSFVDEWTDAPMKWGETDCGCMVNRLWLEVYGGTSIMGEARYKTEAGAFKHMLALGFTDLCAAMDSFARRIPIAFAMPGDVIGFPCEDERWGASLGVMVSQRRAMVIDPETGAWAMKGDVLTGHTAWRLG